MRYQGVVHHCSNLTTRFLTLNELTIITNGRRFQMCVPARVGEGLELRNTRIPLVALVDRSLILPFPLMEEEQLPGHEVLCPTTQRKRRHRDGTAAGDGKVVLQLHFRHVIRDMIHVSQNLGLSSIITELLLHYYSTIDTPFFFILTLP